MKRHQNLLMIIGVIALVALPLWIVKKPAAGANGTETKIFTGADDKAKALVGTISPSYKPWFTPFMEPPSGEVGSLLFALQAAFGAGFIGYYLGAANTRSKYEKAVSKASCAD